LSSAELPEAFRRRLRRRKRCCYDTLVIARVSTICMLFWMQPPRCELATKLDIEDLGICRDAFETAAMIGYCRVCDPGIIG